jgi:multimeric flavodoxin WrbA
MSSNFKDYYFLLENKERKLLDKTIDYLTKKNKVLLVCTSNRPETSEEVAKSTRLAQYIQTRLAEKCTLIDASRLTIHDCTGHVSFSECNDCGIKKVALKDKEKNPTGYHRCWTSFYSEDDELWKITKVLFESDAVVFFGSVRWGQANGVYQRLIERLTWIENRHATLGESNIVKDIDAGIILTGQNWYGEQVLHTQKDVLKFFGFKVPGALSWNWQFLRNSKDESQESYKKALPAFKKEFLEE